MTEPLQFSTIEELRQKIDSVPTQFSNHRIFRGLPDADFTLIPTLNRTEDGPIFDKDALESLESNLLQQFKRRSIPFLTYQPTSDVEWLMLGQHYGLPTRFLDWTSQLLVALYFAVSSHPEKDGAIYAWSLPFNRSRSLDTCKTLDDLNRVTGYNVHFVDGGMDPEPEIILPPHFDQRFINQGGLFSFMSRLSDSHDNWRDFKKLTFSVSDKRNLEEELIVFGVRKLQVFPGLDNLAEEIRKDFKYT